MKSLDSAGKPFIKVISVKAPEADAKRRTGFLAGEFSVPDDFDRMGSAEIEELFNTTHQQVIALT